MQTRQWLSAGMNQHPGDSQAARESARCSGSCQAIVSPSAVVSGRERVLSARLMVIVTQSVSLIRSSEGNSTEIVGQNTCQDFLYGGLQCCLKVAALD